jgi:integrase/recombinase XerD
VFSDAERLALAGYLAGYRGLTHEAYTLDLRQFTSWCRARAVPLFSVRRADTETFARELEARGRARATVTRRLCTIAGFYKYAVEEELLEHSPAAHVRRPRLDYESHATALDRNEVGALRARECFPVSPRLRTVGRNGLCAGSRGPSGDGMLLLGRTGCDGR